MTDTATASLALEGAPNQGSPEYDRWKNLTSTDFPKRMAMEALALFPQEVMLRIIHYCRHATERAKAMGRNPRMIVPDFIGGHGEGKTAMFASYIFACLGVSSANLTEKDRRAILKRHLTVIQAGGLTDFADLTGLQFIGKDLKTNLARSEAYGLDDDLVNLPEAQRFRVVLVDDWTRSLPHMLQGIMNLINQGYTNNFEIPEYAFIACSRNPEGGDYNVSGIDPAQLSRTIPIAFEVKPETFLRQLAAQRADDDISNFWNAHHDLLKMATPRVDHVPEAACSRFRMLFTHLYEFIKHDELALQRIGVSMFGTQFLALLGTYRKAKQPISPDEILNNWNPALAKLLDEYAHKEQDVMTITVQRLATHLNDAGTKVSDANIENIINLLIAVPEDSAFMFGKLVMEPNTPRREEYSGRIAAAALARPADENIGKKLIALRKMINEKMGVKPGQSK